MYDLAVIGAALLFLFSAADYVRRAWIRETSSALATWVLMFMTMALSFWMYWVSPNRSWTANIGITANVLSSSITLLGVLAVNYHHGTLRIAFDRIQAWCLVGGTCVVGFLLITSRPLVAYCLVQCIALIAYFATAKKLWCAQSSTEPLFMWVACLSGNILSIYPAWYKQDIFAWVYLARVLPSISFMIYLILRAQKTNRLSPRRRR